MKILTNSFSANMLKEVNFALVRFRKISHEDVPEDAVSAIGHPDTARILSGILGREIPTNRASVELGFRDKVYVAQYTGPRLPEGATVLPDGAKFQFFVVDVRYDGCEGCNGGGCECCPVRLFYMNEPVDG